MFKNIKKIFIIISVFCLFLSLASAEEQLKKSFSYENNKLGVKITGPAGWNIVPADKIKELFAEGLYNSVDLRSIQDSSKRTGVLVLFFLPPSNATITLTARPNVEQQDIKTPLDVANKYMKNKDLLGSNVTIMEDPVVISTGNITGAHFTFRKAESQNINDPEIVYSTYIFLKDNIVFGLVLKYKAGSFDNYSMAFESALNSLVIK